MPYQRSASSKVMLCNVKMFKFADNFAGCLGQWQHLILYVFPLSAQSPTPRPPPSPTHTLRGMFATHRSSVLAGNQSRFLRVVAFHRWKAGVSHTIIPFHLWPLWLFWLWQVPSKPIPGHCQHKHHGYRTWLPLYLESFQLKCYLYVISPPCLRLPLLCTSRISPWYFDLWGLTCLWLRSLLLKCSFLVSPLHQKMRGTSGDPVSLA